MSAIFYVVAFISLVQLLICCFAEYKRLKNPSFLKACRITTQKFLYFVVFLASLLRAAYFTQPESVQPSWAYYLMSAYYPLLMTCASLVVCFWAEVRTPPTAHRLTINFPSFSDIPSAWHPVGATVPVQKLSRLSRVQPSSIQPVRSWGWWWIGRGESVDFSLKRIFSSKFFVLLKKIISLSKNLD